jgi:Alginate lyase
MHPVPHAPPRSEQSPAAQRPPDTPVAALKAEYVEKGLDTEADSFILYRTIGNDLRPRHRRGQSRENVQFILENEPPLESCEKRWVVNRIFDPEEERAIIRLLDQREHPYIHLPFDWDEYRRVPWDFSRFPQPGFFLRGASSKMLERAQERAEAHARRHKINYVINVNGARNVALRDGRRRAKWVLPWDGNCFLTEAAWNEIVAAVVTQPYRKYFIVPMTRVIENEHLLDPSYRPEADEEPQILFRRDASQQFDEAWPYGRRPKVELLWRLGVPGKWDGWRHKDDSWDLPRPQRVEEAGQFDRAGWVARLFSGRADLEKPGDEVERATARLEAIVTTLDQLDERALRLSLEPASLKTYDEAAIDRLGTASSESQHRLLDQLHHEANAALARGPYSVVDKTSLPPSGEPQDYWHPAPDWWPDPETPDGLPHVKRDGEQVPGTRLQEPVDEKYDRARLQRLFEDTTILAIAWRATGERAYAEHAATLVRRWFIAPETRMTPHLRYAEARMGTDDDQGRSSGLIEMKDLYYFLDAVRLLERADVFAQAETNAFADWLKHYLRWITTSPQGTEERKATNHHGTCYDLQVGAIAAYVEDASLLVATFRDSQERLLEQFDPSGHQPHEMTGSLTAHYCCFNVQSWVNLATLAGRCGVDLWSVSDDDGRGLRRAIECLLPYVGSAEWPWPQAEDFDRDRYLPIYQAGRKRYGYLLGFDGVPAPDLYAGKPFFFPDDGVKPFWMLG